MLRFWGHSHGGNVLALVTNRLGGDASLREEFFHACRSQYRWPGLERVDLPEWPRIQELLESESILSQATCLDLVTLGTPVRYGWETSGDGVPEGHLGPPITGHAVYTRLDWLLFHAEEVTRRFYGLTE